MADPSIIKKRDIKSSAKKAHKYTKLTPSPSTGTLFPSELTGKLSYRLTIFDPHHFTCDRLWQRFVAKSNGRKLRRDHGRNIRACVTFLISHVLLHSKPRKENADPYFKSYGSLYIHKKMIEDEHRTDAYFAAITQNSHLFKDKVVLDVGAGTGILSVFAARAGAKHVYAVEYSDMAETARETIRENELTDKITVVKKRIEDVVFERDIPGYVDVIVSEWMGFCLLYEGMLDSVLFARDHFLKEGGLMFPNKARLFMAAINDYEYKSNNEKIWTDNKYGVKMTHAMESYEKFVFVDQIPSSLVISSETKLFEVDLNRCLKEDLEFSHQYEMKTLDFSNYSPQIFNGFVIWFEVEFSYFVSDTPSDSRIILSTSPY